MFDGVLLKANNACSAGGRSGSGLASVHEPPMFKLVPELTKPFLRATAVGLLGLALSWESAAATNEYGWLTRQWLSDDGLPNNTVNGLAQGPDGFMWLATANVLRGLARFDGVRFEEFPSTNFISPPDRGIVAITVTEDGGVRLATDRSSIVFLDRGRQRVYSTAQGLPNQTVYALLEDWDGVLWICYRDGSVSRILADGTIQSVGAAEGLPEGPMICALASDSDGKQWFAKAGQLGVIREGRLETLLEIEMLPTRLAASRAGGVWVGCGMRLLHFDEGGRLEDFGELKPRRAGTEISGMVESQDGAVWLGTTFSGLYRHEDREFASIHTTHQEIIALAEDREGNIWVGTGGGGLNQVRPRAVQLHTVDHGLPFESVQSLAEDTNGVIWAVTQDGSLSRLIGDRWQPVPLSRDWAGDATCVRADPNGDLWISSRSKGLVRWRDGKDVSWGDPRQVRLPTIHTLLVATNGDVWFGGDSPMSILRLRNGVIKEFALPGDIRVPRASAEDSAGNIWFGSSKGVLLRVEGERLVDETGSTTGEPQPIRCLTATRDGALWIGYAGAGVGLLKNGRYTSITAREGLYDDFISQIVTDDRGWMWFGATRGLFKVRRHELEGLATGRIEQVRSIHYGLADGLPSLQANFGNTPNALRSRDGRIFLSARTALAVVDVGRLRVNTTPPQVLLKRMIVGDRPVAEYGSVALPRSPTVRDMVDLAAHTNRMRVPPDHRRLEFQFTALSFVEPEKLAFRYRLEGVDDDWVLTDGLQRSAVYLRLPDGGYKFQVSACNSEGTWSDVAAEIAFVVTPFVWNTWWFRAGVVVVFTGIIIAIVRYVSFRRLRRQLRQLEEQAALHKERARIAKDIHDDLGANLTQISLIGELARQDQTAPEKVATHLEIISDTARRAVKSLDEIVWAVNPRNDTLAHFIDYTGQFALDYLRLAGLRCRLDLPEQPPARELSTDVRHNLFLVVKEAINNTVKHAHATELRLRISVTDEKLQMMIEDNGQGFDQSPAEDGADGLHNMRQRLDDIGGRCWIQGRPGAGAKVTVEYRWPEGEA